MTSTGDRARGSLPAAILSALWAAVLLLSGLIFVFDGDVFAWAAASAGSMFISAITVQELEIGVLLVERRDSAQGAGPAVRTLVRP